MRHCNEQSQSRLSISLVQQRHCERPRLAFSMALSNPTLMRFDSLMNYTSGPMSESMLISDFSVVGSWIYWFFSLVSNWFIFSSFLFNLPFLDIIIIFFNSFYLFFILFHSKLPVLDILLFFLRFIQRMMGVMILALSLLFILQLRLLLSSDSIIIIRIICKVISNCMNGISNTMSNTTAIKTANENN